MRGWTAGLLGGAALVLAAVGPSGGRADAPAGQYTVLDALQVRDERTGLIWQRGFSPGFLRQPDAMTYCQTPAMHGLPASGWRLPAHRELLSIVDRTRFAPAIDPSAFPGTPRSEWFWSSSALAGSPGNAWSVGFADGYSSYDAVTLTNRARCVR